MRNASIQNYCGDTDRETSLNFVNWYLHGMYNGETDLTLVLFSDEPWFHPGGYVNSQNDRRGSAENPVLSYEVTL